MLEIRYLYTEYGVEYGVMGYFIFMLKGLTPLWLPIVLLFKFKPYLKIFAITAIGMIAMLEAKTTGGRIFVKLILLTLLAAGIFRYGY